MSTSTPNSGNNDENGLAANKVAIITAVTALVAAVTSLFTNFSTLAGKTWLHREEIKAFIKGDTLSHPKEKQKVESSITKTTASLNGRKQLFDVKQTDSTVTYSTQVDRTESEKILAAEPKLGFDSLYYMRYMLRGEEVLALCYNSRMNDSEIKFRNSHIKDLDHVFFGKTSIYLKAKKIHIKKKQERLQDIAIENGITIRAIIRANRGKKLFKPGSKIFIPYPNV